MIDFTINIKAMGAVRMTSGGKFVNKNAQRYLAHKQQIKLFARSYMSRNKLMALNGAIRAEIEVFLSVPHSYTKKRTRECLSGLERPAKKPDIDNIFKAITDACNDICYKDDNQIVEAKITKNYAIKDQIRIKYIPLEAKNT